MYTNKKLSLYLQSSGYKKTFVEKCFSISRSIYSAGKLGLSYTESAFILVGFDQLSKETKFSGGKDFAFDDDVDIEVDASTEKGLSDGLKRLKEAGAFTVMIADKKDYGSACMRHWELSCK